MSVTSSGISGRGRFPSRARGLLLAALLLGTAREAAAGQAVLNGLPSSSLREMVSQGVLDEGVEKYAVRCALPAGKTLTMTRADGRSVSYPGVIGLAPEWADGVCNGSCQEKISSCLASFFNRTGKHVSVNLVSAAPSFAKTIGADSDDLTFPYQEGAFFGSFWSDEVFACQGSAASVAAQVKRFCAAEPSSCNTVLKDAGSCEKACDFACGPGKSGRKVCSAVSCRDPSGRVWQNPITVFVRNKIEAGNADRLQGVQAEGEELVKLSPGAEATYSRVDFGSQGRPKTEFVAHIKEATPGTSLELWVDGTRHVATLKTPSIKGNARALTASLKAANLRGRHDVTVKVTGTGEVGRLSEIEIR